MEKIKAPASKELIIPGKKRIHPPLLYFPRWANMGLRLINRFHNEYHACIYDKEQFDKYGEKASPVKEVWAYNVFTNLGLEYTRGETGGRHTHGLMTYCGIGTGSGTPAITDTEFFTYLSYADKATPGEVSNPDTNSVNHTTEEYYHRHKFFWDLDECNGTLTEVGLCYLDGDYDNVISHAMFQDAEGYPITVVKDDTKVMVVTVTLYLERGTSDLGAAILDDGIEDIIESLSDQGTGFSWGGTYSDSGIYLGDTDQAIDRGDCYGTSYPVLGSTRSYKNIGTNVADTGSGYGKVMFADWNLGEGNGTWYEVGYRVYMMGLRFNMVRFDLPSGLIGSNSFTKTSDKKLRIDLEIYYT